MRSLLDVNVLIALFDNDHINHQLARKWLNDNIENGWASCPITQMGFVRTISGPRYPLNVSTTQATKMLDTAVSHPAHQFWPADLSLASNHINRDHLLGPNQVTDAYLLALAVAHDGRLATFDQRIDLSAVPGASSQHLLVL